MNEAIGSLLAAYGKDEFVAEALGYSERQYRNIKRKIKNGEALPARTVELINLKLQQINSQSACSEESHVHGSGVPGQPAPATHSQSRQGNPGHISRPQKH